MVLHRYGTPDALEPVDLPRPTPTPGDVLVKVRAASINEWDWGLLTGKPFVNRLLAGGLLRPNGRVLGCDLAGEVEAVGGAVTTFKPGDEVYGDVSAHGFGAFAEYVCAPAESFAPKPPSMGFEQAAAIPQAGVLAVQGLFDEGQLLAGQRVLLNGSGGGVGTFALQLAKLHGAHVTCVDSGAKLDGLRNLGADRVIDYRVEDFTAGDTRYDLILDVKTTRPSHHHLRALEPGGVYVTVGGDLLRVFATATLGQLMARRQGKRMRVVLHEPNKHLHYLSEKFDAGQLVPVLDRPFEFERLRDAFRLYESAEHFGKIVISFA